jgi:putative ABC transport system permease protein
MQGGLDLDLPTDDELLQKVRATPHVTGAAARIMFGGMVNAHDQTVFSLFTALDPVAEVKVCPRRFDRVEHGRPLGPDAPSGSDFARPLLKRLGAHQGDTLALLTNDRDGVLNAAEVQVRGELSDMGALSPDKKLAYLPLPVAQELLRMPGRATELAVAVDNLSRVDEVVRDLGARLGPAYEVSSWHDVAAFIDDVMRNQDATLSIISNIFLFMALLGISNTMLMSVRERTREIGTMMAVGVRRRQILALFLLEAALIGLAGGILGAGAGGGLVAWYGHKGMHIRMTGGDALLEIYPFITWGFILKTFVLAAVGAALAAFYPALRASRLRPVEALTRAA